MKIQEIIEKEIAHQQKDIAEICKASEIKFDIPYGGYIIATKGSLLHEELIKTALTVLNKSLSLTQIEYDNLRLSGLNLEPSELEGGENGNT